MELGCEVVEYTSNEVKLAVTGFGGATKDQVQRMVARLLDLDAVPKPADAADALALALCHLSTAPWARASWPRRPAAGARAAKLAGGAAVIASLRGLVTEREAVGDAAVELVVEVGGVGYRLVVAPRTAAGLQLGQEASSRRAHPRPRERHHACTGSPRPRSEPPSSCSWGPTASALDWPSRSSASTTRPSWPRSSPTGNVDALKLVPGVGQKTAARLLLELQARFDYLERRRARSGLARTSRTGQPSVSCRGRRGARPARLRARRGENGASAPCRKRGRVEELLRLALRSLAPRR